MEGAAEILMEDIHNLVILCRCRVEEFAGIVPRQPWIAENTTREVRLEFEAVLLDISRESSSKIWIHVRIMACTNKEQCSQVRGRSESSLSFWLLPGRVWRCWQRKEEH